MIVSQEDTPFVEKPLTICQAILFLSPFVAYILFSQSKMSQVSWLPIPLLGLIGLILVIAIFGLARNLPRWTLPSLGLVLGSVKLFTLQSIYDTPAVSQLHALLWTDFIPSRVLYSLILAFLQVLPVVLILVGLAVLALLAARLLALSGWRRRLGQDWTLLPFILYTANLLAPMYEDVYRGLEPYELAFALVLLAGAWPFLRAAQPRTRMAAMLVATLLAGGVLAFGIYQIHPIQEWVLQGHSSFPRWWEAMIPLLDTLAMLTMLSVLAVFGSRLRYEEPVETFAELTA